jgi:hypothetical protein
MEGRLKKYDLQEIRKFKVVEGGMSPRSSVRKQRRDEQRRTNNTVLEKNVKRREDYKVYLIKLQDSHACTAVDQIAYTVQ